MYMQLRGRVGVYPEYIIP